MPFAQLLYAYFSFVRNKIGFTMGEDSTGEDTALIERNRESKSVIIFFRSYFHLLSCKKKNYGMYMWT